LYCHGLVGTTENVLYREVKSIVSFKRGSTVFCISFYTYDHEFLVDCSINWLFYKSICSVNGEVRMSMSAKSKLCGDVKACIKCFSWIENTNETYEVSGIHGSLKKRTNALSTSEICYVCIYHFGARKCWTWKSAVSEL